MRWLSVISGGVFRMPGADAPWEEGLPAARATDVALDGPRYPGRLSGKPDDLAARTGPCAAGQGLSVAVTTDISFAYPVFHGLVDRRKLRTQLVYRVVG